MCRLVSNQINQAMKTTTCVNCGSTFTGRSDKKFCDDGCRNAYHNKRFALEQKVLRKIQRKLMRNRNLLVALIDRGEHRISVSELLANNFQSNLITGIFTDSENRKIVEVFDKAVVYLSNDYVMLTDSPRKL